jgi:Rieske Fe-S protein
MEHEVLSTSEQAPGDNRRGFLSATSLAMAAGLAGGYGTLGVMLGRFAYPAGGSSRGWLFVCQVDQLQPGQALDFAAPSGQKIVVARQGLGVSEKDFLALSSTCPHLGCRVHWEGQNDRFFCPCHNGAFDRNGVATAGPPAAAGQSLTRFPLKVENGLLFLEAPLMLLATSENSSSARGDA